jgi:hypothetical protein
VGTIRQWHPPVAPPREIVAFLIESQVIVTFIHSSAEVRLLSESWDGNAYEARLWARHYYYTSEGNVEDYRFDVEIDGQGKIDVRATAEPVRVGK